MSLGKEPGPEPPSSVAGADDVWVRATELLWEEMRADPPWKWILRRLGLRQVSLLGWKGAGGTDVSVVGKGTESHVRVAGDLAMQLTSEPVVVEEIFEGNRLAAESELVALMLDEAAAAYALADFRTRVIERWRAEGLHYECLVSIVGSGPIVNRGTLAGTPDWMAHDDSASPQELMAMLVESAWPEALRNSDRPAATLVSDRLLDNDPAVQDDEDLDVPTTDVGDSRRGGLNEGGTSGRSGGA